MFFRLTQEKMNQLNIGDSIGDMADTVNGLNLSSELRLGNHVQIMTQGNEFIENTLKQRLKRDVGYSNKDGLVIDMDYDCCDSKTLKIVVAYCLDNSLLGMFEIIAK